MTVNYKSFTIHAYRAIQRPVHLDLERIGLCALVGVNESGKSTVLQALLAFDSNNDEDDAGRHLQDTKNFYLIASTREPARVSAVLGATGGEFESALATVAPELSTKERELARVTLGLPTDEEIARLPASETISEEHRVTLEKLYLKQDKRLRLTGLLPDLSRAKELAIVRDLRTKAYSLLSTQTLSAPDAELVDEYLQEIVAKAPATYYFDDFRHAVPDTIPLNSKEPSHWAKVLQRVFRSIADGIDVFALDTIDPRERDTAISAAELKINTALTQEWRDFQLDAGDAMKIRLEFSKSAPPEFASIAFKIVETTSDGISKTFYLRDRSKGFFWFFNFVMRLQFNPTSSSEELGRLVYLLDEPGSYLHAAAQSKLAKKLKSLAAESYVVYATHSHHLLNPQVIPISAVHIVEKTAEGIVVEKSYDRKGRTRKHAYQPVYEALQLQPFELVTSSHRWLVVEGITDYYAYSMFGKPEDVAVLPATNADSVVYLISILVASGREYRVLWDADTAGWRSLTKASNFFAATQVAQNFFTLHEHKGKKVILQDLFDGRRYRFLALRARAW